MDFWLVHKGFTVYTGHCCKQICLKSECQDGAVDTADARGGTLSSVRH